MTESVSCDLVPPMKAATVSFSNSVLKGVCYYRLCNFTFRPTSYYYLSLCLIHYSFIPVNPPFNLTHCVVNSEKRPWKWCTQGLGGSIHKLEVIGTSEASHSHLQHKLQTIPISWYRAEIMHHKKLQQDGKRGTSQGQWQIQRPNKGTPTCLLSITNLRLSAASCRGSPASCWFPCHRKVIHTLHIFLYIYVCVCKCNFMQVWNLLWLKKLGQEFKTLSCSPCIRWALTK